MIRHFARDSRVAKLAVPLSPGALALSAQLAARRRARAQGPEEREKLATIVHHALRALVGEELLTRPEHILSVIDRELVRFGHGTRLTVHVHPEDGARVRAALGKAEELPWDIAVLDDAQVHLGGCLLCSDAGTVDARLETRLDSLDALLTEDANEL